MGIPFWGPLPVLARPPPGAFSPLVVRRDRLWVGLEGLGAKVARGLGRELYSASVWFSPLPGAEDEVPAASSLPAGRDGAPCPRRDCRPGRTVLSATQPRRAVRAGDRLSYNWRQGSAAMSATHPTRLETRTKESNARASQRVLPNTPRGAMKVRADSTSAEVGSRPRGAGRTTGPSRPLCRGGGA